MTDSAYRSRFVSGLAAYLAGEHVTDGPDTRTPSRKKRRPATGQKTFRPKRALPVEAYDLDLLDPPADHGDLP
jgi:hypothetical protein